MTRFARYGQGQKPAHEATKWSNMKSGGNQQDVKQQQSGNQQDKDVKQQQESEQMGQSSPLKRVNKDKKMKFKGKQRKSLKCHNCHQVGHKVSTCPQPPSDNTPVVQCYNCKATGHKAFKCPDGPIDPRLIPSKVKKSPVGLSVGGRSENPDREVQRSENPDRKVQRSENRDRKVQRSENRRVKRINNRDQQMVCYSCREPGHRIADCPEVVKDVESGTDVCLKCGSTEHQYRKCKVNLPKGEFPFAKCFICKEIGHLSSQCPDNPLGIYPNGGCCKLCGSVEHLQRDCLTNTNRGKDSIKLDRLEADISADQDVAMVTDDETEPDVQPIKSKKPKVVKF